VEALKDLLFKMQHLVVIWKLSDCCWSMELTLKLLENVDKPALHQAASGGHLELVRLLLQNGANVNAKDGLVKLPFNKQHLVVIWKLSYCCWITELM
jgi:hypothetical protein